MQLVSLARNEHGEGTYSDLIDNTNQADFELYGAMAEHDNAGYPIAYCLLTTATAIADGKRKLALASFLEKIRDTYLVQPTFAHTDKDIAEIGAFHIVWSKIKLQMCEWHIQKAVRERLGKPALATTAYDAHAARGIWSFIDLHFIPDTKPNPNDNEDREYEPNARPARAKAKKGSSSKGKAAAQTVTAMPGANSILVKLSVPQTFKDTHPPVETRPTAPSRPQYEKEVIFCPVDLCEGILDLMHHHCNMHPTIPGPHAMTVKAVGEWCAREMYTFCKKNGLRSCWAYLWGNWYRPGRWELWARAECPSIPRLRTTMICESQ